MKRSPLIRYCAIPLQAIAILSVGCAAYYTVHLDTAEYGDTCSLKVVDDRMFPTRLDIHGLSGDLFLSPSLAEALTGQLCTTDSVRAFEKEVTLTITDATCGSSGETAASDWEARIEGHLQVADKNIELRGSTTERFFELTYMKGCNRVFNKAIVDLVDQASDYLIAQRSSTVK